MDPAYGHGYGDNNRRGDSGAQQYYPAQAPDPYQHHNPYQAADPYQAPDPYQPHNHPHQGAVQPPEYPGHQHQAAHGYYDDGAMAAPGAYGREDEKQANGHYDGGAAGDDDDGTRDRGVGNLFTKKRIDEYGTEQRETSYGRAAAGVAAAIGLGLLVKKQYEKRKASKEAMLVAQVQGSEYYGGAPTVYPSETVINQGYDAPYNPYNKAPSRY
ncbi:hypothetical protein H4R18_000162 [Coemansia javaensis]|uniref:Uncharacterized protein n=1 Tax=Coemansia javaensis TaxID=2761396 RepID=A0A9W8HJ05_9FUNG|nr:hypothetical protein H4R18_000162 [Coemansia javaensis]